MESRIEEKLAQAQALLEASDADVWLTFCRETAEGGDPILPFLIEGGLTWQSALLVGRGGRRVAIVGSYDAPPLQAGGQWREVVPYVQSIREPLLAMLHSLIPHTVAHPRIAVNYSVNDVKSDGLSHGMYLLLESYLRGTRFEGCLTSAEAILTALRSRKTESELEAICGAIVETDRLFDNVCEFAEIGMSELEIQTYLQALIEARRLGFAWDKTGNPIVNSGPASMIGHGIPSPEIHVSPGHILHLDLGVTKDGYSSDIQRCWYAPKPGETEIPNDLQRALTAVNAAITAGSLALRPGIPGWQADAAARQALVAAGYPEYQHALGHQVGRMAHDGGGILGPRWERYGSAPDMLVEADQVYTLELGVLVAGRGYLGVEEMVVVTEDGIEWLTLRQTELPLLGEPASG